MKEFDILLSFFSVVSLNLERTRMDIYNDELEDYRFLWDHRRVHEEWEREREREVFVGSRKKKKKEKKTRRCVSIGH